MYRTRQRSFVHQCSEWTRTERFARSSCFRRTTSSSRASTSSRLNRSTSGHEIRCRSRCSLPLRSPPTHKRLPRGIRVAVFWLILAPMLVQNLCMLFFFCSCLIVLFILWPCAGPGVERILIDPLYFLTGYRKSPLNWALSVLSFSLFFLTVYCAVN